jgi:hypothetical protein
MGPLILVCSKLERADMARKLKATMMVLQHRNTKTIHLFDSDGNTYCGHGGGRRDVENNYDRKRLQTAQKDPKAKVCGICKKNLKD